jgi:hypothetical protein
MVKVRKPKTNESPPLPPPRSRAAPSRTVTGAVPAVLPRAPETVGRRVPAATVTAPVKVVLLPLRVRTAGPSLTRAPAPEMTPLKVAAALTLRVRVAPEAMSALAATVAATVTVASAVNAAVSAAAEGTSAGSQLPGVVQLLSPPAPVQVAFAAWEENVRRQEKMSRPG